MKRSWFGLALLLVLLAGALLVTWTMERIHEPIARELEQAGACALAGQWHRAESLAEDAEVRWEKWAHFRGCFADHTPMEEIDGGFAQVKAYSQAGEPVDFAAACAQTARRVEAMGQAHGLNWWNVL